MLTTDSCKPEPSHDGMTPRTVVETLVDISIQLLEWRCS